jgi:hypothetical protein
MWIGLGDNWLEVKMGHFVSWLRFAKIGFVVGPALCLVSLGGVNEYGKCVASSRSGS